MFGGLLKGKGAGSLLDQPVIQGQDIAGRTATSRARSTPAAQGAR